MLGTLASNGLGRFGAFAMTFLLATCIAACHTIDRQSAPAAALPSNSMDLLGAGGPQDALSREIYYPGSGTDW